MTYQVAKNGLAISILICLWAVPCLGATQLLVPAYFAPGDQWTAMTNAAAKGAAITAIVNPNSGPGTSADPAYAAAINAFRSAGGKVIGYVHTTYGSRKIGTVETDVQNYSKFYSIDGIFVDEMTSDDTKLSYYKNLYTYIKGENKSFQVVGNPGTAVDSSYSPVADTLVMYESADTTYAASTAVSWSSGQPASRFANIVYSVGDATAMAADMRQAAAQNVGYVYFTDDGGTNPYDTLPSFFSAEVGLLPEPASGLLLAIPAWMLKRKSRATSR